MTLHVVSMLWDANAHSLPNSRCFNETWATKLLHGFTRNLTIPFKFILFTDHERDLPREIIQERITSSSEPGYGSFTEPYRLNAPMILVGLDTVIVKNIDHLAAYCLTNKKIALPRDPYQPDRSINGVALVPPGHAHVYETWQGENDMVWLRTFDVNFIDDLFPGQVLSCKAHDVRKKGLQGARVVYFHGRPKPHELMKLQWIKDHWR